MEDFKRRRGSGPVDDDIRTYLDAHEGSPDVNNEVSSMDCTGLIPSEIQDEADAESYDELYSIHGPGPNKDPR